jgi:two-component system, response regulator PdtaR
MKKILILEDEKIIALHLQSILEEAGYNVVATLNGTGNVVRICKEAEPDIIICDIYLKGKFTGIEIMHNLQKDLYIPVIFLTAYSTNEVIRDLSKIKHDGYIIKPFSDEQVLATIKLIEQKYYNTESIINLSYREKQVIFHIINGLSNEEIANQINLSPHTVRTHRKNIYRKLEVNNVSQMTQKISEMNVF